MAIARRAFVGGVVAVSTCRPSAAQTAPAPPSATTRLKGGAPRPLAPPEPGRPAIAPAALAQAQAFSDRFGGTSLLVWREGRLVYETYAPGVDVSTRLKTYSMAKSVLGLAYGVALARGVVALDDPVGRHVEEWRGDPRGAITLRQLLQMRSGLKLDSLADHDPRALELAYGGAVSATALSTPAAGTAGAVFEYANLDSFLAGLALDRALVRAGSGRYVDFLSRALWRPLGQADAELEVESAAAGEPRFFAGLDACARDWLRLGLLFIEAGRSGGRSVVPAAWIATMTAPSPNPSYGVQIWRGAPWTPQRRYGPRGAAVPCNEPYLAPDLVFFDGFGGQRVYASRKLRLVIVRTGAASTTWEDSTLPNTLIRGFL